MKSSLRTLIINKRISTGEEVSTKELGEEYNVVSKTIERDIKIINAFLDPMEVKYNASTKKWKLDDTESTTYLSDDEIFVLNNLERASQQQGIEFHKSALKLFSKFKQNIHNTIYNHIDSEDISDIRKELTIVDNAIINKKIIELEYHNKKRRIEPLKLANFDGYWYLVFMDTKDDIIKKYYFKDMKNINVLDETFVAKNKNVENKLNNAINAYFDGDNTPYEITLTIHKNLVHIFKRKPISKSQRIIKEYQDGSMDISIFITHDMEIIPKIQQFIPFVNIVDDNNHSKRILATIKNNLHIFEDMMQ